MLFIPCELLLFLLMRFLLYDGEEWGLSFGSGDLTALDVLRYTSESGESEDVKNLVPEQWLDFLFPVAISVPSAE